MRKLLLFVLLLVAIAGFNSCKDKTPDDVISEPKQEMPVGEEIENPSTEPKDTLTTTPADTTSIGDPETEKHEPIKVLIVFDAGENGEFPEGFVPEFEGVAGDSFDKTSVKNPIAKEGWKFTGWDVPLPTEFSDKNLPITAQYEQLKRVTITFSAGTNGKFAVGTQNFFMGYVGASFDISKVPTPIANAGHKFMGWNINPLPEEFLSENMTIEAQYAETVTITFTAGENGTFANGAKTVELADVIGAPVTPPSTKANDGFQFANWSESVPSVFENNLTITANFERAYVDLGLSVLWATCNVGASKPEEYGDYYAWGEIKTKREYTAYTYVRSSGNYPSLAIENDAAAQNWGGKWRIPNKAEYEELQEKCHSEWTSNYNGKAGCIFYKKKEGANPTYNVNSDVHIFLPAAGYRSENLKNDGSNGYYRTRTIHTSTSGSDSFHFYSESMGYVYYSSANLEGHSVRAVFPRN